MAVWTPGFVPMKMQIRLGASMSTRGERWAYFEGEAYLLVLLVLRCFGGRGDDGVVLFVGFGRLGGRVDELEDLVDCALEVVSSSCLNLSSVPLNEDVGCSSLCSRVCWLCDGDSSARSFWDLVVRMVEMQVQNMRTRS